MITEQQFLYQITDVARLTQWDYYHTFDSRRSNPGFPDLVLVGHGRALFVELKAERGRVRPEQRTWLLALSAAGLEVALWRPSDLPVVVEVLGVKQRRLDGVIFV